MSAFLTCSLLKDENWVFPAAVLNSKRGPTLVGNVRKQSNTCLPLFEPDHDVTSVSQLDTAYLFDLVFMRLDSHNKHNLLSSVIPVLTRWSWST